MHLIGFSIPEILLYLFNSVALFLLFVAIRYAPWRALLVVQQRQHVYFFGILCLVLLWKMHFNWMPGLILHPMGMAVFTVVFGWSLTLIAGSVAMLMFFVLNDYLWGSIGIDFLLTVVVPATVCHGIIQLVLRQRSKNLFLYMLGAGFIGAILGLLAGLFLVIVLGFLLGEFEIVQRIWREIVILIMIGNVEGFLNGALVTAMTVLAPDMVKTFDSRKYLNDK